jgi:hypothetical protein
MRQNVDNLLSENPDLLSPEESKRREKPAPEILGSDEPYLKLSELSHILNVKPDTIIDWSRRYEDFPCLALPGSIRIRASEVVEWLKQFKNRERPPTNSFAKKSGKENATSNNGEI